MNWHPRLQRLAPEQRKRLAEKLQKHNAAGPAVAADKRLVAYFQRRAGHTITIEQLRAHLRARLPEQMIPSAFIEIQSWPRMPNGKIDRNALPLPTRTASSASALPQNRVSELEQKLARIWAEVLGVAQIGRDENFFDLGGHSLLAIQILTRIRELLNIELTLRSLFQAPTVAALAQALEQETSRKSSAPGPIPRQPRHQAAWPPQEVDR